MVDVDDLDGVGEVHLHKSPNPGGAIAQHDLAVGAHGTALVIERGLREAASRIDPTRPRGRAMHTFRELSQQQTIKHAAFSL